MGIGVRVKQVSGGNVRQFGVRVEQMGVGGRYVEQACECEVSECKAGKCKSGVWGISGWHLWRPRRTVSPPAPPDTTPPP